MCGLKSNNHATNVTAHLFVTMTTMRQYITGPLKLYDSFLSLVGLIFLSPAYHRSRIAILAHFHKANGMPACKMLYLATTAQHLAKTDTWSAFSMI